MTTITYRCGHTLPRYGADTLSIADLLAESDGLCGDCEDLSVAQEEEE